MLDEPYRWVEAIRNRREYLEDQLRGASPVVGLCYRDGYLLLTTTPGPRKLFEIYNHVAFAAVGHPADIEKLRKAVIDIAHLEAFNLSAQDVSLNRLVNFGLGPLVKGAFDEVLRSPFTARVLMAQLDPDASGSPFYTVDADGSFDRSEQIAAVAGTSEGARAIEEWLEGESTVELPLEQALQQGLRAWGAGRIVADLDEPRRPEAAEVEQVLRQTLAQQRLEAAVLDRSLPTRTKFRLLAPTELEAALAPYTS